MVIELWQLSKEEAKKCYALAFPDHLSEVFVNPSKDCLSIFTKDNNGLQQNDVNLYNDGSIGGSPRTKGADEKIRAYLKELNVIGYK